MSLLYSSVPVGHDSATLSLNTNKRYEDTESAKWNPANIDDINCKVALLFYGQTETQWPRKPQNSSVAPELENIEQIDGSRVKTTNIKWLGATKVWKKKQQPENLEVILF